MRNWTISDLSVPWAQPWPSSDQGTPLDQPWMACTSVEAGRCLWSHLWTYQGWTYVCQVPKFQGLCAVSPPSSIPSPPLAHVLVLSQLESNSSLSYTSQRICPETMRLDELISRTKGCPDGWSKHAPPKLKSYKNSSNCLMRKKVGIWVCIPYLCLLEGFL